MNLVTVHFSLPVYNKLEESELKSRTNTAQDLCHVLAEFARYNNVKPEVKLTMVDNELQKINASTCGNFQLYLDFLGKGRVFKLESLFKGVSPTIYIIIRLLSRVYHFSLLICFPCSSFIKTYLILKN